ncbi:MAG: hypothetical protein CBB65_11630 [Hyphomonadaceae bacterium TMED5]|nr:penicillin-binding protein activator [Ponticaulis sp.]OUX98414.1 MAG: hypothetical protein CBB65_11630 [Hyphomonadaceae bacterium TMED5]|tara:strand:- start:47063 stop:48376 length:1314 start_codon:yes stop_codon:yes gene_type:complete
MTMKLELALRQFSAVPSLVLAGFLVTACATAPARPPAPISTGQPRTDPVPMPDPTEEPVEELPEEVDPDEELAELLHVTPDFMEGRDVHRVAVLLPFSHSNAAVRHQASGLLAAVEMALFDQGANNILILPKDTAGDARQTASVTSEAIREGADVIIGPLFATSVQSAAETARQEDIPVIAFSNDRSVAGGGAYLMSFPPEEEVARIVDYALAQNISYFAFMGPSSTYARRVETALRFEAARRGGQVVGSEFYAPDKDNQAPVDEAQRLANRVTATLNRGIERVAIMIPDDGVQLRAVAPLLPYYGVNLRQLQYIGTSVWDDEEIWREPVLENAVFAMADPEDTAYFASAYQSAYGSSPASLASLGYDAAALAMSFVRDGEVTREELEEYDGFHGMNGLFRFRDDGTVERGLAIMAISPSGPVLVEDAPSSFVVGGS